MARKSIIDDGEFCAVCGRPYPEVHHIFFGANRKLADKYGLTIPLCYEHHRTGEIAPHRNRQKDLELKRLAQKRFMEEYPDLDFMEIFGRNYL